MAISIIDAFEHEPPPLDYVWPGFLSGSVGCLAAAGSTGKSVWALGAAMCVASPHANAQMLNLDIEHYGPVVLLNAEDPEPIICHRLHAMGRYLDPDAREEVGERLLIESLVGQGVDIMSDKWLRSVIDVATGARLVILDTHSRWSAGVPENDNALQAEVLKRYEIIAKHTGAAVLFLHHVAKGAATEGRQGEQQAARGATAIIDNCRWSGFLQGMTQDQAKSFGIEESERWRYVSMGGAKENYGRRTSVRWYERREHGVLMPVELAAAIHSDRRATRGDATY